MLSLYKDAKGMYKIVFFFTFFLPSPSPYNIRIHRFIHNHTRTFCFIIRAIHTLILNRRTKKKKKKNTDTLLSLSRYLWEGRCVKTTERAFVYFRFFFFLLSFDWDQGVQVL